MNNKRGDTDESLNQTSSSVSALSPSGIITLLTDFGTSDYFVAAMKGVILGRNPQVNIVDITHDIPPHDIEAGAFVLLNTFDSYPSGTIHLSVVDPGVGSSRRPLLIAANNQFFVGPDNGLISYVCEQAPEVSVFHLTNEEYFRTPVSPTFHGRDIFAPVAAALSIGMGPEVLGTRTTEYVTLPSLKPETSGSSELIGRVIHLDRFGNCVTNISKFDLTQDQIEGGAKLSINGKVVSSFRNFFAEEASENEEELFAVWGSAGFLEIVVANRSAAKLLNIKRGDAVVVSM